MVSVSSRSSLELSSLVFVHVASLTSDEFQVGLLQLRSSSSVLRASNWGTPLVSCLLSISSSDLHTACNLISRSLRFLCRPKAAFKVTFARPLVYKSGVHQLARPTSTTNMPSGATTHKSDKSSLGAPPTCSCSCWESESGRLKNAKRRLIFALTLARNSTQANETRQKETSKTI